MLVQYACFALQHSATSLPHSERWLVLNLVKTHIRTLRLQPPNSGKIKDTHYLCNSRSFLRVSEWSVLGVPYDKLVAPVLAILALYVERLVSASEKEVSHLFWFKCQFLIRMTYVGVFSFFACWFYCVSLPVTSPCESPFVFLGHVN